MLFLQKSTFLNQNLQLMKKHFKTISDDTWFYHSHMILRVFPRALSWR